MKKTLKSFGIKSLAAFLSVLMILTALPISAFAINLGDSDDSPVDYSLNRLSEAFEVEDLRGEFVKHFRLEDGSYIAAQYDVPVHYLVENGKWQDIDNSLSDIGNEYSTNNAKIKFAKKITGNENLFTLHDGNYKITMSLNNAIKKTKGEITNAEADPESESKLQKMMMLENLTSEIIYKDILTNVDLQYVINSGNIKENLIVKKQQDAYSYTFTVKLNNLDVRLDENGSVLIFDPNTNEVIYYIPAPIVYDANGEYADDSYSRYSLEATGNKTFALTVSVDSAWMNEDDRAFPVTIDPPIYIPSGSTVTDTYINSASPTDVFSDEEHLIVGNTTQLYWKTSTLPTLPNDAYITNADFSLRISTDLEGTFKSYMGAFQVTTNWDETLTWNDYIASSPKGDYDLDGYTDFSVVSVTNNVPESTWHTWNITSIVKNWYAGQPNYGITISDINRGTEGYSARNVWFASNNYSVTVRLHPKLVIAYKDMKGIEDYWTTTSQSAGIAGSGHVNNATGDLSFTIGTLSTTDSLMPYTPTLTYNTAIKNCTNIYSNSEVPYLSSAAGSGFKWSMQESIVERTYMGDDNTEVTYYVWSDADGTEHYFTPCVDSDGNTVYKDEDGIQMTLAVNTSSYTISDSSNTVRTFTRTTSDSSYLKAGGVLSKITDVNGNYVSFNPNSWGRNSTISLVPNGLSSITSLKIAHNASGKINRILNESSQEAAIFYYSTTYNGTDISPYNGGYLRKIVYVHQTGSTLVDNWNDFMLDGSNAYITVDATATYAYNSAGYLIKARDELSGYEVNYGYTNGKVTSITEKAGSASLTTGQQILLSYYDNYTEVRTSGTDDITNTSDDIITRYVFDDSGRTITAYSIDVNGTTIYGASSGQFNTQDESKNSIRVSSYVSDSAANYLMNGGFENSTAMNYWYPSSTGIASRSTAAKYAGKYGATISATSGVTSSIYQYVELTKGAYTLSLNINTNNCAGATVKLVAKSANNTFTEVVPVDEYAASGAYAFASLNFDVTATSENYQIIIQITGSKSTAQSIMVDNVMLAKSVGVSAYNMVELGNFEDCCLNASGAVKVTPEIRWTRSDTTYVTVGAPDVETTRFGESLKIVGSLDSARSASLNVFNASSSTDLTTPKIYKISGFAKADKQMSNSSSKFALKVDVTYYNQTEPETFWFDFANTPANQWQFISGTFDVCSDGGAVRTIKVSCVYDYQSGLGTAYFDNISVVEVRDGSAESYTYYESGMPKTYDNGNYKEWYFYADDNTSTNLTRKITSTNGVTDYTFDSKDRITSEVYYEYEGEYTGTLPSLTPRVKTTYAYNSYGLITNTTIRTVKYSGSSLVDTSPANIISTTTNYNVTSGSRIFGSVSSEVDSLGRTTRYFYDSNNGRLKFVVNPDQSSGMAYTYDGSGNLTLVEPVTYSNSTPSAVTNAESVQYVYTQDRLTQIITESTTYNLAYDTFGNTTSIKVGSNTLISSTYNSRNGKLATTTYGNGLIVRYVYDELDRTSEVWYTIDGTQTKAYSYEYDANGNMCKFNDHVNNRVFRYKYDDQNRMTGFIESSGNTNLASTVTTYDEQSRIHTISHSQDYALTSSSANLVTKYTYNYNDKNNLSEMTLTSGSVSYRFVPSYDALERVSSKTTSMTTASGTVTSTLTYGFTSSGTNRSLQVAQLVSKVGNRTATYNYSYDSNGNITKITNASGEIQYQYQYDDLGQLIREDNRAIGLTYVYYYDNAGNITGKAKYLFSTGSLENFQNYYSYTYGNDNLLTYYFGQTGEAITYDSIGNPLTIGTSEFNWNGRQLASYKDGTSKEITFGYNDTGSRIFKEIIDDATGEVTRHEYTLNGTQIVKETVFVDDVEAYTLIYLYDESEAPVGIRYRARSFASGVFNDYLFEKNLQGDIVAIYNQSGTRIAVYNYDAWGATTVTVVNNASATDKLVANTYNPFRYRGYYYDNDLGMYYLGSRYYNQKWGRFLNADTSSVLTASPLSFTDKNLFAYCDNNPIARTDDGGEFWHVVIGAAVGAVGGAVSSIISQAVSGEKINWKAVGISAAGGAVSGAITAACPCMAPALAGVVEGAVSAATYAATEKIAYGRNPSLKETLKVGITSGVMAGGMQFVGQKLGVIQCFIAGTLVATKNGLVPIEDIKPGDLVWATDEETGETAYKEVVQIFRNETEEWVHVTVNNKKITCTPNHLFYAPNKGWTAAIDLRAGDILVMLNGERVVVEQVQHELLEVPEITYNFEVEDYHTYHVSDSGILVHNECPQKRGLARQKAEKMTNKQPIKINGRDRIPDYLNIKGKALGEAKSVKYLCKTSQLTDMFTYGHDKGMKLFLKVEKHTRISAPLRTFLNDMGVSINVFRN